MPLLEMLGFLLGLVFKVWMFAAVFCFYTFVGIFSSIPVAVLATIGIIIAVSIIAWACAAGLYG